MTRRQAPIEKMEPRTPGATDKRQLSLPLRPHAITFDHTKDKARQEFKADSEIRNILRKHGGLPQNLRPITTGTVDYDVGLHEGLQAIATADRAWRELPDAVRRKYKNWQGVEAAIAKGDLIVNGNELSFKEDKPKPPKDPVAPDPKPADTPAGKKTEPEKAPKDQQ